MQYSNRYTIESYLKVVSFSLHVIFTLIGLSVARNTVKSNQRVLFAKEIAKIAPLRATQ